MSVVGGTAHPDDLLPAYALDALPDVERAEVDEHVQGCARCQAELAGFREAAAQLAGPVAERPPSRLWAQVQAGLGAQEAAPTPPPAAPADASPTAPRAPGAPRVTRRRLSGVLAAAVAALAVAVVGAVALTRPDPRVDDLEELAHAAMESEGAQVVALHGPAGAPVARVVVGGGDDGSFVMLDDLAPLPSGDTYQLWSLDGAAPVSLGVLGDGSARVVAVPVPQSARRLAVSHEHGGGAVAPRMPPVAAA